MNQNQERSFTICTYRQLFPYANKHGALYTCSSILNARRHTLCFTLTAKLVGQGVAQLACTEHCKHQQTTQPQGHFPCPHTRCTWPRFYPPMWLANITTHQAGKITFQTWNEHNLSRKVGCVKHPMRRDEVTLTKT